MVRAVAQSILLGLLLAFVTTAPNKEDWDIYSFHINSTVTSRYAITVITSRVVNRMDEPKEIEFHVRIPKNAFISKFRMLIDGQMYDGIVKAKEEAQQQYNEAVSRGQSAGLVSSVGRTLEEFKTSVTVAALQKVTFELTYEELLIRRLGKYELQIHARPMQPVKDFKIDIHINEKAGINFLEVKGGLSTKTLANAITKTQTHDQAWVYFYPTEDQQKICDSCGEQGMNGDLVIVYDVLRSNPLGEIKESDGYFVHHFAPGDLPRIPKNVVFIIDRSGSMHGRKIEQTRAALLQILGDLAEDDYFGLITFNGNISPWKRELLQATQSNLDAAKDFARKIRDSGATNINDAVLEGARMLNEYTREGSASLLILLTDGDPTTGVTNIQKIQSNVREAIDKKFPLYCLGFGFDVNFEFLEKMALENSGVARRIYEDFDADLQLRGFYEEVATPLLTDVMMIYIGGTNLTQTNFSQYYNGSEIVVAGQITDNSIETFSPQVVAISLNRKVEFTDKNATVDSTGTVLNDNIKRVWAFLTVKQLLEKELQLAGAEKMKVRKEALELSLKYSFVTPLTSMVVTKPPGEDTQVLHKPKEGEEPQTSHGSRPFVRGGLRASSGMRKASGSRQGKMHPQLMRMPAAGSPRTSVNRGRAFDFVPTMTRSVDLDDEQTAATEKPTLHRFLLRAENQTLPLCYDVTGPLRLKLLHDPNGELSVNGELDSTAYSGFRKIAIHYKSDQHIEFDTTGITVRDGQSVKFFHWGQDHTSVGSTTVIMRDKETDVSAGDARMIILLHERKGEKFLWPAMRQFPSGNSTDGLLSLKPAVYEEIQQTRSPKLRINGQEINVIRADAVDYSISATPSQQCWLVLPRSVLQRELSDFIVTQL
ncbi:inter-alpha-trypsin inhibitor heavy chain H3 isoform X2 [Myripristis murdjan]|uniref:inter-alpha-trypsin inhibitor heavy chain H3 isoform X2 n=1 Tax=Myripristis murdjan TaxID=586833 RepID=UPI001175DAF7|nr:inter-alpha-trypsin inhibitor heavy chain H3-like isoform X2 [Myripristis murdjan]